MFLRYYDTRLDPLCQAFFFCRPRLPPRLTPATANVFLLSETPFICLTHFRKRENTFAFVSAPAIAQPVYLRRAQGEAEVPTNVAQAIAQPVYLRRAQDDGETASLKAKANVAPTICFTCVPKAHAGRGRSPDKRSASYCSTCVPKAREKGWRNRVHTNVGALCAVERANAVKAPASLKIKATDTGSHLFR